MRRWPSGPPMGLGGSFRADLKAAARPYYRPFSSSNPGHEEGKLQQNHSGNKDGPKTYNARRPAPKSNGLVGLSGIARSAGGGFGKIQSLPASAKPPGAQMARRVVPASVNTQGVKIARRVAPGPAPAKDGQSTFTIRRVDAPSPRLNRPVTRVGSQLPDRPAARGARPSRTGRPGAPSGRRGGGRGRKREGAPLRLTTEEEKDQQKIFWLQKERAERAPYEHKDGLLYNPHEAALGKEDLITNHVGTMLEPRTQVSDAMARLARRPDTRYVLDVPLARRLSRGELVRFKDEEEKTRILELAEKFAEETAAKISRQKKKVVRKMDVGFEPVDAEQREKLVSRVVRGDYELHQLDKDKAGKEKAVGTVQTALQLNSTWDPTSQKEFLRMFESLWPKGTAAKPQKS